MVNESNEELYDRFIAFYRDCCREKIEQLAQNYPDEQRALYIDYTDLEKYDRELAEDYLGHPKQMRTYAEQALLLVENSADVSLSETRIRLHNLPDMSVDPGNIRAQEDVIGRLVTVRGYVREASEVVPALTQAAFECQRCETLMRIPQSSDDLQEPHRCKGCERQGPFRINYDRSEFGSKQTLTLVPLPEADPTMDGELAVTLEGDLAGEVTRGDRVEMAGVVEADQEGSKTAVTVSLIGEAVSSVSTHETGLYSGSYLGVPESDINGEALKAFVARTTAVLRTQNLGEFETQSKIITPFLHLLGWNIAHPEVRFEYSDREIDDIRADYALLGKDNSPVFVVEAKQEGQDLDLHTRQLKKYMRVFQTQYGLLTNGERYLFFCTNPNSDEPNELVILDCWLSNLEEHRDILAAYGRASIVGDHTSLEKLAEAAQTGESGGGSGTRNLTAAEQREQTKRVEGIINDLQEEVEQGAPIDEVYRRAESEFGISQEKVESELAGLRQNSEVYEAVPDHLRLL